MLLRRLVILWLAGAALVVAAPPPSSASGAEAFHPRDGLPRTARRLAAAEPLRIAYLGGSITAADGWRPLTTAWLRARFPRAEIPEINAGLPGTGSDLGACRLGYDVLRHQPDLVLVEFAINDATTDPAQVERTMEGIVRHVRTARPEAELLFVYTVSKPLLPDLEAGRFPAAASAMERVAEHYGVPSLHFGFDVVRRIHAQELVFHDTGQPDRNFSADGVHPTALGHRVYFETLERLLPSLLNAPPTGTGRVGPLPGPLHDDHWQGATLLTLDQMTLDDAWTPVPRDDPQLRGATRALLPPLRRTERPGSAFVMQVAGTHVGLYGIAAPESGRFRVTIDDRPPVEDTFFDAYCSPTFCRQRAWFFPDALPPGVHTVRVELLAEPVDKAGVKARAGKTIEDPASYAPQRLTLGGVLVVAPTPP